MPVKRLKRPAPVFAVLSRHVKQDKSHRKTTWSKFTEWNKHEDNALNIRDAIRDAMRHLKQRHVGTVVYITQAGSRNLIDLWHCKWGHNNEPFVSWKPNAAAEFWKRRV